VSLATIAWQWTRLGCIGFGGPPAHITLLRRLCVYERHWLPEAEFEDGLAATNLLPGPASTQLAIFCAWRLRGVAGAIVGGVCFIVPGLALIIGLSALFLSSNPPVWVLGAAAGSGAAVPAVALNAASMLVPSSWSRALPKLYPRLRWIAYAALGVLGAATVGAFVVLVFLGCGLLEVAIRGIDRGALRGSQGAVILVIHSLTMPTVGALMWVAFKVGALSYGGGFVIVPLMQSDAVSTYHWMTSAQFLNAVALGQVTPGPVVQTVAVVGYAAGGVGGALIAAVIAFTPSFLFVIVGGPHFDRIRATAWVQWFLNGAGPAVIGAIAGSAIPLALSLHLAWQFAILAGMAVWLLVLRRNVVVGLLIAGAAGALLRINGSAG